MLENQVKKADRRAEPTEFACYKSWCDRRDANPLSLEELLSLGVFLIDKTPPDPIPGRGRRPIMPPMGGDRDFVKWPIPVNPAAA